MPRSPGHRPSAERLREFEAALRAAHRDAVDHADDHLGPLREKAARYYNGEPFGDEADGRSAWVQTELRGTGLAVMPHLLQVFASDARRVFEFVLRTPRDVEAAKAQIDCVNHIVANENDGYLLVHDLLKDAPRSAEFASMKKSNVPDASLLANLQAMQMYGGGRGDDQRRDRFAVDLAGN